jgi:four helix bundle protein
MEPELNGRLFRFSVEVIKLLKTLDNTPEIKVIKYQLAKSATSAGANYEEAQAASSKPDFTNKVKIALKEMRESNYWLRILKEVLPTNDKLDNCLNESIELKKILGAICTKASQNK